ncbi:MAG: metallophosphoesterase, partial [Clostridia bacterium]|nr:metallophosphoesterase [Clostridia bacterium]
MAKKRRQCRRRMLRVFGVILILIAALIAWAAIDSRNIDVTRFTVSGAPEAFSGFKIVQISDLHNAEFGTDNQKLIDILKSEAPDAIVITGDLIDARRTNTEIAESFARRCMEIADCYYVPGNHEARLGDTYDAFESALIADGVNVLRNGSVRIRKEMDAIRIIGVDDPAFAKASDAITNLDAALEALSSDDFTILLAHRPELIDEHSKW